MQTFLVAALGFVAAPHRMPMPLKDARGSHLVMRLPDGVLELLDPAVKPQTVEPLWKEFRKCYPTEKAAVAAARRNVAVLLPFINTADNIRFNYQILCNELGFDEGERLNIISKNPGVLGNKPGELARSSPGEVRFSMGIVTFFDAIPPPVRSVIPPATAVLIVVVIAKRLSECAGTCG